MKHIITIVLCLTFSTPFTSHAEVLLPAQKFQSTQPIKILIVPGHDNEFSGAMFNGVKEADLNLKLAEKLAAELHKNPLVAVTVSRNKDGYIAPLVDYFKNNEDQVQKFIKIKKKAMNRLIENGTIEPADQVPHADAPTKAAYQLYATNKWIDEQGFDLVIHIHFNDYGSRAATSGEYTGYSIYVPDTTLPNHDVSLLIGTSIGKRLHSIGNTSNALTELKKIDANGVIQDSNLIALGSNRTLSTPSILIEYAYIYEPAVSKTFFETSAKVFASATTVGLQDYLSGKQGIEKPFKYSFTSNLTVAKKPSSEVLMLQYALFNLGMFPPTGKTRSDCEFDGIFGDCTKAVVKKYQALHKITADGIIGKQGRILLNKAF